jgi:hypothetical protein
MKKQLALVFFLGLVGSSYPALAELPSIVQTIQGSEIDVKKPLVEVGRQTEEVFKTMGIQVTSNKIDDSGSKQIIRGKKGENTVEVQINQKAPDQTHLVVIAKKGLVALNKDLAQQVIEQIIRST